MSGAVQVLRAKWDRYRWLRHGFGTRRGGVSSVSGRDRLNWGCTRQDSHGAYAEDRRRFFQSFSTEDASKRGPVLVTVRQVHSAKVCVVQAGQNLFETPEGQARLEGDGLITNVPGVLLGVWTADCVPVLVADVRRRIVGAFHAGWRGTAEKIVEKGIATMGEVYGSQPEDLVAAVGPSIGPCCYAVGSEVWNCFEEQFGYASELFEEPHPAVGSASGRTVGGVTEAPRFLNLWEANRKQLLATGVSPAKISVLGECTACTRDASGAPRYFSYRADNRVTGRMLSGGGHRGVRIRS